MLATTRLLLASLVLGLATAAAAAITNPNFAPEQTFDGAGDGNEIAGPAGWTLRDVEGRAVVSTVDFALVGERVFWFETLTGGYGANKLDQCVPLSDPADFSFTTRARTATPDSDLRVRLNAEFYASEADCLARDNDLDDAEEDFRLDEDADTWATFILTEAAPVATTHVRLSLRARDRTGAGNNPADEPKFIYFDGLEISGGELVNGDFEDTMISEASFGEDQGPFGWTLRSVADRGLVISEATAELGSAFRFTDLGTGFGDNTLEQCVPIAALDPFVFDVSVWPNLADEDLSVRLAVDLHASEADCINRDDRIDDPDFDFDTDEMTPESWNALRSGLIDAPANAEWARLALRARDRRDDGPEPIILFDRVALTDRFFVGGTVSGLADGAELTLDNNGEQLVIASNGSFVFPTGLTHATDYTVTVNTQPISPSQTCTLSAGSGQIDADDVTDIEVTCVTNSFTIGGNVEGLEAGNSMVLQLNGNATLSVSANQAFTFPDALEDSSAFAVTVFENPSSPDQTCTVANGEGVLSGSDVDDVLVTCATDTYTVGGTLSNLAAGTTLVLQNNGADDLALSSNGAFQFPTELADGASYSVAVTSQPTGPNQVCSISNASGNVSGAPVDTIMVSCVTETYSIGGTLSGLASGSSVVLQNNSGDDLSLSANGTFEFATELDDGTSYAVTVLTQPTSPSQTCTVSQGTGNVAGGPVTDVQVTCATDSFLLGGFLTGLAAGNSLTLTDGAGQTLVVDANGAFVFNQPLADGSSYGVTAAQQPTDPPQTCAVSNGSGTIAGSDVTGIEIACDGGLVDPEQPPARFGGAAPMINPGFGLEQAFAGQGDEFPGPDGWIMRDLEDRRGLVSTIDFARSGSRVFRFESPQRGFGDNKLDQCLPLTDPAAFALRLHAWSTLSNPEVQVRVNVESYPSAADCDARSNRLDNTDFDFPLTAPAATWQALSLAQGLNPDADHARISIRMRDRSDNGDPVDPPVTVLFDDISATGASLVNGDFEAGSLGGALFGEDQGPLGWTLRNVSEFGMVVPEPSASGGSAFQFTALGEGFGDNSLEQCVPLDIGRFVLSAEVWPELSSSDLRIRLNIDFHANLEDCLARENRIARSDTDVRTSDLTVGTWNAISSRGIARPSGAGYARIALRARDRISPAQASTPIILFDQIRLGSEPVSVPVNHPLALLVMFLLILGLGARALNGLSRSSIT